MSAKFSTWRQILPAAMIGATAYLASGVAAAADTAAAGAPLEEVIITGSSIAQKADTSPLPVTTLTEKDIAKTGLTSVTDLVQNLPAMQGFVPSSSSVNGGGGGATTAALHALPSKYTLVLVDGQRVAPFGNGAVQGGGSSVNLETIPLDAVERVEVLTDGASALYGADAIAGVVNFILKKNRTDGSVFYNASIPDSAGGSGWNAGFSKGFGDLKSDGYNILVTYSHDIQDSLLASQRAVSRRGSLIPFTSGGVNYIFTNRTSNTEPANVILKPTANPNGAPGSYNPYLTANGNCGNPNAGAQLTSDGTICRFNYAATVEDIPSSKRDSGLLKGTFKVGDNSEVWAEVMLSQIDLLAQYAPPAQPLSLSSSPTSSLATLWTKYVAPYLAANNITATKATLGYRAVTAGGRTDDWATATRHIAFGWDGNVEGWDLKATAVISHGRLTDYAAGGYLDFNIFKAAIASGAYDPVASTGSSALSTSILHTPFQWVDSDLKTLSLGAQHKLFDMDGGASILSVGAEYSASKYQNNYSNYILSQSGFSTQPADPNYPVGGNYGQVPVEADRTYWGLFGEWLLPVENNLNVNASLRYDSYSKTHSTTVFSAVADANGVQQQIAAADLGNTFTKATGKLSFRYTPLEQLSIRGSVGTGFKAPTMTDIAGALTLAGSTSNSYTCPFPGTLGCSPGSAQYDLLAGPNGLSGSNGLKPEKSTQWTFGVRVEPAKGLAFALDYWNVSISDQVLSQGIAESVGFANPTQYQSLFIDPFNDPVSGLTIGFIQAPFNGGKAHYSGIDWHFSYTTDTAWGNFSANWTGTDMLKQDYTFSPGGDKLTDLGVYGPDQAVVFRVQSNLALSLQTGKWVNTLMAHYKSSYRDQSFGAGGNIYVLNPDGSFGANPGFDGLNVPSYTTLDWQTVLSVNKVLDVTLGVRNLTAKDPPLSFQTGGGGNQAGYDGRYADPIGRAWYVRGTYKF
jgi:iron complex outermembrane recepter protein